MSGIVNREIVRAQVERETAAARKDDVSEVVGTLNLRKRMARKIK